MLAIMSRRSACQSREERRSRACAYLSRVATPVRRTGDINVDKSNRCMEFFLRVEYADISLLGGREENQDRVAVAVAEKAALLLVVDGMGGHADGARAAQVTQQVIVDAFWHTPQPLFDPLGFLHLTLGRAHDEVVKLGVQLPLEQRPRATCRVPHPAAR